MSYVDHVFSLLSGRAGEIAGIFVVLGTIGLIVALSWLKVVPWGRGTVAIAIAGAMLSAVLAAPFMLAASRPRGERGKFAVQQAVLILPSRDQDKRSAPILMEIWFPAQGVAGHVPTPMTCADLQFLPLAESGNPKRLLLYFPHFGSRRNDNTARLSYLASFGYVAVAFDDIAQDAVPIGATLEEEEARLRMWHVLTPEDFERTLRLDDIRVKRQAEKASSGLDRLTDCAATQPGSLWRSSVDYNHVGFLGYSFGGSTAAEAAIMDHRIVAAANLDGNLFGQALAGRLAVPYLYVMSDRPAVTLNAMMSKDVNERYGSRIDARDRHEQARLAAREGSVGIRIKGSVHASLSDAVLEPHASRLWLLHNPIAFFDAINLYTRQFFDVQLAGEEVAAVDRQSSRGTVVQTFQEIGMMPDKDFVTLPP